MPNPLEDFVRQSLDEILRSLPPEELVKGLSFEERMAGLDAVQRQEFLKEAREKLRAHGLSAKPE